MGQHELTIAKQAARSRNPIPDKVRNAPFLPNDGSMFFLMAFDELSTDRPVGFGKSPIPFRSLYQYAEMHEMTQDEFEEFTFYIRALDNAYLTAD